MTQFLTKELRSAVSWSAVCGLLLFAAPAAKAQVEFRPAPGPALGPFSEAVRVGNLLFLSGAIGTDSTGTLVKGGITAEAKQVIENVKTALARNGLTMDRVVKCTVFLADIAEWPAFNTVYATYFPGPKPARSALGGVQLVRGARVELECIAAMR
jgi:2-iminobutanoate/2-iminopropanoate deaminase